MNKNNLEKLIEAVKGHSNFNWIDPDNCIGALAARELRRARWRGISSIEQFLGVTEEQAHSIYWGNSFNGEESDDQIRERGRSKEAAIQYLENLRNV